MLYFALMGGFVDKLGNRLYLDEQGEIFYRLDQPGERDYLDDPNFSDLELIDADIEDKSKASFLSKEFAIVQTGWFILRCIACRVEHLPITELEITTLAFAALNFTIYTLWWSKPLAVERPIHVHKRRECSQVTLQPTAPLWARIVDQVRRFLDRHGVLRIVSRVGKEGQKLDTDTIDILNWCGIQAPPVIGSVFEMLGVSWPVKASNEAPVHSNFYAGDASNDEAIWLLPCLILAAGWVACIFGGIHCIAWWFQFPSYIEQILWRVCAAVITFTPLCYLVFCGLHLMIRFLPCVSRPGLLHDFIMIVYTLIQVLLIIVYIFARVTLLVLTLMSLRSLPPGAFQTVSWANYIPHI